MKPTFSKKLFLVLTLAFALTAIAGTLLHELSHYLTARAGGYHAVISYAYTHWADTQADSTLQAAYAQYGYQIMHHLPYPQQEKVALLEQANKTASFWITLAGPLQTMLTGCLGLFLIFLYKEGYQSAPSLSFWAWLPVFLSLFWTRQIFNFFIGASLPFLKAVPSLQSDETKLALYFHWPGWVLSAATALIGLAVSTVVSFKIVPQKDRAAFLLAGLVGGLGGFILWAKWLGPILLP